MLSFNKYIQMPCNQAFKCLHEIGNLLPNPYPSGLIMKNSIGAFTNTSYGSNLKTNLVFLFLDWHAIGTKRSIFTVVENWAKVPLSLLAAQQSVFTCLWMSLSPFSEAWRWYFTCSGNSTRTPLRLESDIWCCGLFILFRRKCYTSCCLCS